MRRSQCGLNRLFFGDVGECMSCFLHALSHFEKLGLYAAQIRVDIISSLRSSMIADLFARSTRLLTDPNAQVLIGKGAVPSSRNRPRVVCTIEDLCDQAGSIRLFDGNRDAIPVSILAATSTPPVSWDFTYVPPTTMNKPTRTIKTCPV